VGSPGRKWGLALWVLYWQLTLAVFGLLVGAGRGTSALEVMGSGVVGGVVGGAFGLLSAGAFALFALVINRPLRHRLDPSGGSARVMVGAAIWLVFGGSMVGLLLPCTHAIERFCAVAHDDTAKGLLTIDWGFWARSIAHHSGMLALIGAVAGGVVGAIVGLLNWVPPAPRPAPGGYNPFAGESPDA
jgi:hypothetical protein